MPDAPNDVANANPIPVAATYYEFRPAPDITVYQLACVLEKMLEGQHAAFSQALIDLMPMDCLKHFERLQPKAQQSMFAIFANGTV